MTTRHFHLHLCLHLGFGALLFSAGCASAPTLRPSPLADRVQGLDAAAEASDGPTRVVVQGNRWPGEAEIELEVTPLKVTIENRGAERLRVTYGSFVLRGTKATYAALPPFKVDGSVPTDARIEDPYWERDRFLPAPYYRAYDSSVGLYSASFSNPIYYRTYYPRWSAYERLPTAEMLAWALPEGVVEPGGSVTGYLYFEQVDDEERQVDLHIQLDSDQSAAEAVNVTIPLVVVE